MPAWWAVTLPAIAEGSPGETAATHSGSLTARTSAAPAIIDGGEGEPAPAEYTTVWADTAADAVAQTLTGTIHVDVNGATADYAMGAATAGTRADQRPFAVEVAGTEAVVLLEDLAGVPGATPDWDYDDRTWHVDVFPTVGLPVLYATTTVMPADSGETVSVVAVVSDAGGGVTDWRYTVRNVDVTATADRPGVTSFVVESDNAAAAYGLWSSQAGWEATTDGSLGWVQTGGAALLPGQAATFGFSTDAAATTVQFREGKWSWMPPRHPVPPGPRPAPPAVGGGNTPTPGQPVTVTITAPVNTASEDFSLTIPPTGKGKFTVTRTGSTATALTVLYDVVRGAGFADQGDYTERLTGEVVIPVGAASTDLLITPIADGIKEGPEKVTLKLKERVSYKVGSPGENTVTIADGTGMQVRGRVWKDVNANGRQDRTEPGIPGVTVRLYPNGLAGVTGTTDAGGGYQFTVQTAGMYSVEFVLKDGHAFTQVDVGQPAGQTDIAGDSDARYVGAANSGLGRTDQFSVTAGVFVTTIDAGMLEVGDATTRNKLVGPGTVPGNSWYTYAIRIPGQDPATNYQLRATTLAPATGVVATTGGFSNTAYDFRTDTTLITFTAQFKNDQPAKVRLEVVDTTKAGTPVVGTGKVVTVVQVIVAPAHKAANPNRITYSTSATDTVVIGRLVDPKTAFTFEAVVTLRGPGNNEGVDQVRVGFVQTGTEVATRARYADPTGGRWVVGQMQGKTFLDSATVFPWYDPIKIADGKATPITLGSSDTPDERFPLAWESDSIVTIRDMYQADKNSVTFIKAVELNFAFTLHVAAQTKDAALGGNVVPWPAATMRWDWLGSRTVDAVTPFYTPQGTVDGFTVKWKDPDPSKIDWSRNPTNWSLVTMPTHVDLTLPLSGDTVKLPKVRSTTPQL